MTGARPRPDWRLVALITLGAAALRLPGLLRDHPVGTTDEAVWIFKVVEHMVAGDWNPHLFEYPAGAAFTAFALVGLALCGAGLALGTWASRAAFLASWHAHLWRVSVAFRLPVYLAGLAGVPLLYLLALRLSGPRAAWMSAAILAVTPPFAEVTRMHFVDNAAISAALGALVLVLRAFDGQASTLTWLALGVCLGTAANLKLPYVLTWVILPALALATTPLDRITEDPALRRPRAFVLLCGVAGALAFLASWPWRVAPELAAAHPDGAKSFLFLKKNLGLLGLGTLGLSAASVLFPGIRALVNFLVRAPGVRIPALTGALTFFVWSPFYLADPAVTLFGLMIVARSVDPESVGKVVWTWHATIVQRSTTELVGPLLGLLGLAGIAHAAARGDTAHRLVLVVPLIWFLYTGFASYSKLLLMYLFVPFLALHAARLLAALPRAAGLGLLAVGLALPLADDLARAREVAAAPRADTRQQLAEWYRTTCPGGEPLAQDPNLLLCDAANPRIYQIPLPRRSVAEIRQQGIRYVITNDRTTSEFSIPAAQAAAFARDLATAADPVARWQPGPGLAGPVIEVWKLR